MTTLDVTDAAWDAEVLARAQPILVDFWAPWCVPCRRVAPLVEEVAERHAGHLTVVRLDVDSHPAAAARYDVLSLPTLILFKGGEPVARLVGKIGLRDIETAVLSHIA